MFNSDSADFVVDETTNTDPQMEIPGLFEPEEEQLEIPFLRRQTAS